MYLSIRDCMTAWATELPALGGLRELGVDSVELELSAEFDLARLDTPERVPVKTDADIAAYREHLKSIGIRPCALLTACDFSAATLEANVKWVARSIEIAHGIGAPAVRIDSAMARERELDFGERVELFAQGLGESLRRTKGLSVTLGIENHGFQGNNLAFLLNIFKRVESPRLGMTLDTGNFYWRGYPLSEVYGILALLAPYAKHTHLKNIRYPESMRETTREAGWGYEQHVCPLDEGDIQHARVVKMLADAGYTGDLCIEDESLGHYAPGEERLGVLGRDVRHVQDLLAPHA